LAILRGLYIGKYPPPWGRIKKREERERKLKKGEVKG
jgi:hypothetical protein